MRAAATLKPGEGRGLLVRVAVSWSGGKDAALAGSLAGEAGHDVVGLASVVDPGDRRLRAHGTPAAALEAQAEAAGLRLEVREGDWEGYEAAFRQAAATLRDEAGVEGLVFGDVDLEGHREWGERVAGDLNLEALYPLWGWDHMRVVEEAWEAGIQATVVAVGDPLDQGFLGDEADPALAREAAQRGASPSGEDGAYHSFVTAAPAWERTLGMELGGVVERGDYAVLEHRTG